MMPQYKEVIKKNLFYFISSLLLFLAALFVCITYGKAEGFYLLNPYHNNIVSTIFIYLTWLGDGLFCVAVGLLLFIFNKRYLSILVISSYLLSGLIAQILKYFIVEARPAVYLKDSTYQYFIENVTLHNYHAFPSGHTASAFALATVFAVTKNNTWISLILLIIAAMVGYSRIYLGQHFLIDVFGGAVVGVAAAIICLCIFNPDNKFFKKKIRYISSNTL